jgi:hypothetical protein
MRRQEVQLAERRGGEVRRHGLVYRSRLTVLPKGATKEQEGNYVFRFDPKTKTAIVIVRDFDMPNGLWFLAR